MSNSTDMMTDPDTSGLPVVTLAQPLAFPTVKGFGAAATGGEGGRIIEVTNLNDDGPGSLRQALIEEEGPRVIHFSVAGNIVIESTLNIRNGDVTIAGETAPGDGVAIVSEGREDSGFSGQMLFVSAPNVIIRFMRLRRQGEQLGSNTGGGGVLGGEGVKDIVFDHTTWSWVSDDLTGAAYRGAANITYQHCMFYESVPKSTGEQPTTDGKGALFYGNLESLSMIGNAFAHLPQRNPSATTYRSDATFELINNLVYNRAHGGMSLGVRVQGEDTSGPADGTLRANVVGNRFIEGEQTFSTRYDIGISRGVDQTTVFVRDNITMQRPTSDLPEWDCMGADPNLLDTNPAPQDRQAMEPFDFPFDVDDAIPTSELEPYIYANAGANIARDSADARVLSEIETRTGTSIDVPFPMADLYRYPVLEGEPWDYADGTLIPADFAAQHGISSNDDVIREWTFDTYRVVNDIGATAYQMWRWWRAGDFDYLQAWPN